MELSIIIVNYNTRKITQECIKSVVKNTNGIDYEIIVIDNASKDGSVKTLENLSLKIPNLKLIKNRQNLGFGKGNNQGMKIAKGKFVLLLNTDTIVHDNALSEMVSWMGENEKVGVATCALKNKDGSLQGTGGYFPTLFRVFAWMFFLEDIPLLDILIKPFHPIHGQSPFYKGTGLFQKAHRQDWLTAAFFMIRREVVETVGGFDKDYFMYTEEVDYCWRIKSAGWDVWYQPTLSITHLGGASSTQEFPILSEYKGIKLFYKKHMPGWQYPFLIGFLKAGAALRTVIFGILKGREVAKIYAKAFQTA